MVSVWPSEKGELKFIFSKQKKGISNLFNCFHFLLFIRGEKRERKKVKKKNEDWLRKGGNSTAFFLRAVSNSLLLN